MTLTVPPEILSVSVILTLVGLIIGVYVWSSNFRSSIEERMTSFRNDVDGRIDQIKQGNSNEVAKLQQMVNDLKLELSNRLVAIETLLMKSSQGKEE